MNMASSTTVTSTSIRAKTNPLHNNKKDNALGDDNVKALPINLINVYEKPHKALGLDPDKTDIATLREAFRKFCLMLIPEFTGFGRSSLTDQQLNLAYHLIRGTIKSSPKELANTLDTNPFLDFKADYILPLLHPTQMDFSYCKDYRGFKMLSIACINHQTSFLYGIIPQTTYIFDVHYALRRQKVEKKYEDFVQLHLILEKELLTLPSLPVYNASATLYSVIDFGNELARYLMRIHKTLANRGLFTPRILMFLQFDYERIHTEEEGAIVALLDNTSTSGMKPLNTAWCIINDEWLAQWRKFVMGRPPRRYFPPGKINNHLLLEKLIYNRQHKKTIKLMLSQDYRCINYNVWRFLYLVHGGGPIISRKEQDIYSMKAYSFLQAIIMIQTRIRIYLAKKLLNIFYLKELSNTKSGKKVLYQLAHQSIQERVQHLLTQQKIELIKKNLNHSAIFTQSLWRLKRKYVVEKDLEMKRKQQEQFDNVHEINAREYSLTIQENIGTIVKETQPIIHIGNTNLYHRILTDSDNGIPFRIMKQLRTEEAIISNAIDESVFFKGSILRVINNYPTNTMTYDEIKKLLSETNYPINLILEKPYDIKILPKLDDILYLDCDEILTYNMFKLALTRGIRLIKHNQRNHKSHITTLKINSQEIFYRTSQGLHDDDQYSWNSFSLFELQFIREGHQSPNVKRKKLNPLHCFEIAIGDSFLLFEFPSNQTIKNILHKELLNLEEERHEYYQEHHSHKHLSHHKSTNNMLLNPDMGDITPLSNDLPHLSEANHNNNNDINNNQSSVSQKITQRHSARYQELPLSEEKNLRAPNHDPIDSDDDSISENDSHESNDEEEEDEEDPREVAGLRNQTHSKRVSNHMNTSLKSNHAKKLLDEKKQTNQQSAFEKLISLQRELLLQEIESVSEHSDQSDFNANYRNYRHQLHESEENNPNEKVFAPKGAWKSMIISESFFNWTSMYFKKNEIRNQIPHNFNKTPEILYSSPLPKTKSAFERSNPARNSQKLRSPLDNNNNNKKTPNKSKEPTYPTPSNDQQPFDILAHRCDLMIFGIQKLVQEIRGSQTFVDRQGIPIRRTRPKVILRKIDNNS